jgi:hypothetical protein
MRRILTLALVTFLSAPAAFAARAGQTNGTASISGTASSSSGQTMANATVHLRNLGTGQLAGSTTSSASGQFSFFGLQAGNYTVEVLNATGEIVGTSATVTVAAGAAITGVVVTSSAAAGAAAAAGGGSFFASTAGIITLVAAGAAVAGVTVAATRSNASPSK